MPPLDDEADTDRLLAEVVLDGNDEESKGSLAEARPEIVAQLQAVRTIVEAFDALGVGRPGGDRVAPGRTLADRVREEGPLPVAGAVGVARELCRLLAAKAGGDVRPNTIIENRTGGTRLLDGQSPPLTPLCTAPEVVCGAPSSPRSDVYSVGVVLFYALAGTYPVHEPGAAGLRQRHHAERGLDEQRFADALRQLRGDVPGELARCVAKALAPVRRRYRDVSELERALDRGGEIGSEALPHRWWPFAAAVALLAVFLALHSPTRPPATAARRSTTAARFLVARAPLDAAGIPLPGDARVVSALASGGGFSLERLLALRALSSGQESALPPTTSSRAFIESGGRLIYAAAEDGRSVIQSTGLDGSDPQRLCADCGIPLDGSADGRFLLLQYDHVGHGSLGAIDRVAGRRSEILASPAWSLSHARLSSDGRWVAWHGRSTEGASREFVAPFRGVAPVPESDWVPITDGHTHTGAPAWSPKGGRLYYLSDGDGHRCVWTQALDGQTMHPIGEPRPFYHQHGRGHVMGNVDWAQADLVVARDLMVFTVGEPTP
jgi:hypothetical protein